MRLLSATYVLLGFALAFSSCQKELLPDNFVIGNSNGVVIKELKNQVTSSGYGQEDVLLFDVNNDGESDFKFYTYAMDSLGDQDKRGSCVWTLDTDIQFGYQIAYETLFSVTEDSDKGLRKIIYNERSHFNCAICQNLSHKKDLVTFSSPVLLSEGNSLNTEIKWSDKLQILSQLDQSRQFSKENDDLRVYNNIQTGIWDEKGEGYIPFRIKNSFTKYTYGWIKLRVVDHRRIEFFEIAIQE